MDIGRTLKKGIKRVGSALEGVGQGLEHFGGKILSDEYKKDLQKARDIVGRKTEHHLKHFAGIPAADRSSASVLGPVGYTYLGYKEQMEAEEGRDYELAQKREAAQRVKAEAERGQDLLRRRRLRRLGTPYASGFGSASTDFKTVLGI